jgi:cytochrome c556
MSDPAATVGRRKRLGRPSIVKLYIGGVAAICLGLALAAAVESAAQPPAAPAAPPSAVTVSMRQMGGAQRALGGELAKETPDPAAIKAAAQRLDTLAGQLPGWFAAPVTGAPTRGKPEIWSDAKGFAAAAEALKTQTAKLASLADGGDIAALKAQAQAIGPACKACHDIYRAPEQK